MNETLSPRPEEQPKDPEKQFRDEIDQTLEGTTWNSPGLIATSDLSEYMMTSADLRTPNSGVTKSDLLNTLRSIRFHKLTIPGHGNIYENLFKKYEKTIEPLDDALRIWAIGNTIAIKVDRITNRPAPSMPPSQPINTYPFKNFMLK